jgi:phosphoribosylanthranilate isomerase
LTRDSDLEAAVDIGADAIGLVLHAASPRAVDIETA